MNDRSVEVPVCAVVHHDDREDDATRPPCPTNFADFVKPERAATPHLDEVVEEPDHAEADRGEQQRDARRP